ncbi:MAG: hypothetical protein ACE5EX_09045, partial [Phycisphaerae bacterium]
MTEKTMRWEGRRQGAATRSLVWMMLALTAMIPAYGQGVARKARPAARMAEVPVGSAKVQATAAGTLMPCTTDADCDDGDGCTLDTCPASVCLNESIPGCVPCAPTLTCPLIDVVFIMDTSGSMRDEAAALCTSIDDIRADLDARGVSARMTVLGLAETPGGIFSCLTGDVVTLFGAEVPINPTTGAAAPCPLSGGPFARESWGPATAIVADRFDWRPGSRRMIIPIADEGPCNGSFPGGCQDPGEDRDALEHALELATVNNVMVSPITGTGADTCVTTLAGDLAAATGGTLFETQDAGGQLPAAVLGKFLALCELDDACDDGDACTTDDTCVAGACSGTDINTLTCTSSADCLGSVCDSTSGLCTCSSTPSLNLVALSGGVPVAGCLAAGEMITVNVDLGITTTAVAGAQFSVLFDPSMLAFVDLASGSSADAGSPFSIVRLLGVNEAQGSVCIFAAVP